MNRKNFLKRLKSDQGNITVLAGALVFGLIGFGGVAIDYGRASGLHRKMQAAADIAVREAVRGKTDAQVKDLVHGQLDAYLREMGVSDPKARTSVAITRSGDTVKLAVVTTYDSLFGRFYGQSQQLLNVATDANARAFCVADGPQTRWTAQSEACPSGLLGSITHEREERRTASCASETAGAPTWSGWAATGTTRNRVESCAAPCVVPAAETRWSSATAACASGYVGSRTIETQQRRTASCPSPTGSPLWGGWTNTTTTRVTSDTCALRCTPAAAQTQWVNRTGTCPSGQTGSIAWQAEQRRTSSCPSTTGNPTWSVWSDTGTKRSETNTCAAAPGHVIWTTPGTYSWTVPAGVTRISALAIGGGGSGLQVRPYDEYHNYYSGVTSSVSGTGVNLSANGGTGSAGGCGGSKQGGGCGGDGGTGVMAQCPSWTMSDGHTAGQLAAHYLGGGGGGAGGYSGKGGNGGGRPGSAGSGGGGGGGASVVNIVSLCNQNCGGGGGAGLYGAGSNGNTEGSGGSGGSSGSKGRQATKVGGSFIPGLSHGTCGNGGTYGAGGGGASAFRFKAYPAALGGGYTNQPVYGRGGGGGELSWGNYTVTPGQRLTIVVGYGGGSLTVNKMEVVRNQGNMFTNQFAFRATEGAGANGAVRILWGAGRSFPSTNVSGATN